MIARGVNQMAAALAWRERMQDQVGRLLTAFERTAARGGAPGGASARARRHRGRDRAPAQALYQPQYDTNEWGPTAVAAPRPDRCLATSCDSWWVTRSPSFTMRAPRPGPYGRNCSSPPRMPTPPADSRSRPCALGRLVGLLVATVAGSCPRRARRARACSAEPGHRHASANPPTCTPAASRGGAPRRAAPRVAERELESSTGSCPASTPSSTGGQTQGPVLANVSHELRTPLKTA